MGIGDRVKDIGNYVRKRWRSTDADSYDQYKRGREHDRKHAEQRRKTKFVMVSRTARRQSGGASTKSAMGLNAKPRSLERRDLAATRATPSEGPRPV
jgi:hypothetical protein